MIGNIIPEKRTEGMEMKGRTSDDHDDNFPVGMRVLVVDDDPICLLILENLLRRCQYDVTTCGQAILALTLLREKKNNFDLVISDVHMPDMDGFKLLELVGLEMDLPVIMMSANGETSAVMKGITHGACDYLLKPVRLEELKNIWQHVLRKRTTEKSSSSRDNHHREGHSRCSRSIEEGEQKPDDIARLSKKRKDQDDDEEEDENDHDAEDPSSLKKPRVVWTVELHQQFVQAVNTLGIDKAVPKRILELMNVQGLTRENVASHLQKYRLYLRRLSGVASHQGVIGSPFGSGRESPFSLGLVDGFSDLQMLAQSGQLSAHSLASLQAGIFGRLNGSIGLELPGLNSSAVLHYPSSAGNGSNNSVGRTPRNANTGMLAYLPPGSELSQLHQKQVSKHGEMGVQIEDNAPLLSMQQHQQLLAVDNSSYVTGSRGNNNDMLVSQTNDAMIMQLMQQQQSQNRSRGLSNLSTEGNLKTLPTNASFPSNACGLAATWCNVSSPSEVATDSVQSALSIRETYSGALSVDDSKATMNSSVSTIKFLLGPASHNCPPNEVGLPSITSVGNQRDIVTFDKLSNAKAFGIFNTALKQELDPTLRQECWQNQNQNQNQNLSQESRPASSSIIKNQPSQSRVLHQGGVQTYLVQSQRQNGAVHNQNNEFDAKQMGNLTAPAFKGQCESKQSTADSQMNIKEECRISLLKMGGALFPEHCSSTDELMNILYKQQQEPVRFADHDSALDVYPLKTCI